MKHHLKCLFFIILCVAFFSLKAQAQLTITGLTEDPERNKSAAQVNNDHFKTSAVVYTDTLKLPFFEDFTDVVIPVDSIVIDNTTDSVVRVYDNVLNSFPDSTLICVGFTKPKLNPVTDKIARIGWYMKKIGPNEFILDSTDNNINNVMKINADTVIKNAFWRLITRPYSTDLDTLKWLGGGNTYINNRYPLEPVSYNVATFDGLKSDGVPYNTVNVLAKGFSDNLTSLPINLKSYVAGDSIYFSYFWQHTGVGDAPETDDYLLLEFKDSTGVWNAVQTINGNISYMTSFQIQLIPVTNPIYFCNRFQFRLRSWGRLSGPFDIWNVDHLYLNKNRNRNDTIFDDKSIGNVPVTFLNRFTAMPYNQFFANPTAESGDMLFTNNNLGRQKASQEFFYTIADYMVYPDKDLFSRDTSAKHQPDSTMITPDNNRTFHDICTPDVSGLVTYGHPIYIDQAFRIPASDTANIFFADNNKFSTRTILWDYYAYDDGTPEWGVAGNQTGTKIANQFTINLSDTLTDIDIYFTRSKGPNMNGRSILLSVWDNSKTLVSQQVVQVGYGGFKRYTLTNPVIVPAGADYYVGYQQNFNDLLSVGYDKNYDHSDKIFFNLSGSDWNAYNLQPGYVTGSMMIRPVFNKHETLVTPIAQAKEPLEALLYPVPVNDVLNIQGKISDIALYDFTGRKVAAGSFDPYQEDKAIQVSALPDGLYIVVLKFNDQSLIKKIIVQHGF